MENKNQYLHEVAITAIIVKDGRYLITRRSANKKRFPGIAKQYQLIDAFMTSWLWWKIRETARGRSGGDRIKIVICGMMIVH